VSAGSLRLGWVGTGPERPRVRFGWADAAAEARTQSLGPSQLILEGCNTVLAAGQPPSPTSQLLVELETGDGALDYVDLR